MKKQTWFITGASKGFGQILVNKLLEKGDRVVATSRNMNSFKDIDNDNFLGLEIKDLTNEKSIIEAFKQTINKFGTIDVLVNNAGYGIFGAFEEVTDKEIRDLFDVNVFGTFNTIRNVLPIMRKANKGRIINISSSYGFVGDKYWGAYNATKFAIDGLSEALSLELNQFNIKSTSIMPGPFRTNFLDNSSLSAVVKEGPYKKEITKMNELWAEWNGSQAGDPYKAMDALIKIVDENLDVDHIFFGQHAYNTAEQRIEKWKQEMKNFEHIGKDLDYSK
ncbi:hypothetical protein STIUS_v1c01840 [Spiroplasma sp. TIUS-1]|uniref:SDR family oxidoreductase n=1 Tax=Spiroplasma sp. TIUS-1 TaxID=216963 RepID=UPI001396D5AA|nr:SDR family oxidoreductase [Spiroplasma sp. TIUS-1]QHX35739.1 hypothetical protein STIUS_v1c01840 [Spiroplasma sp. TIUS-1]